jgi:cysteinyl-tRNA synthetase
MRIYNTLSGKKEDFKAALSAVNLFVCGPTVYDYSHIGHARTYVFFDAFVKFLRKHLGLKVTYLQNITDIDDKIINRAIEQNKNWKDISKTFGDEYMDDMASLGVTSVDTYAPTTDYIPEIISQTERLVKKGFAYTATDPSTGLGASSVYFDVRKFPEYGKLSHQKIEELKEGVRNESEPGKKYFADFALWKASKESLSSEASAKLDEPSWKSPWGAGRPGWHIEDTATTEKHFGPRYQIHGGGLDLIFPHHEAEIAQMESVSGLSPMAQIWMHTGLLMSGGEKMSKSLGNFVTIKDFLAENSPEVLRYIMLSSYYRSPLDFTKKSIDMASASISRIKDFIGRLEKVDNQSPPFPVEEFIKEFWKHLEDDFNTPQAFGSLFELIKESNKFIDSHSLSQRDAQRIIDFISDVNDIFGILPKEESVPAEIMALRADREKARSEKDFSKADEIREKIEKLGWNIKDSENGAIITKTK